MQQNKHFKTLRPFVTVSSIKGLLDVAFLLYCTNAVAVVQEIQSGNTTRASSQAEPLNTHPNEIAVGMEVVGHVPKLMAQWVTKFLKRASNSGTVVITGKLINRGAGYGLELPCEFKFQGDKYSCGSKRS